MKIAVAAMGNTVAGHFGHCENFIFFDTADGKILLLILFRILDTVQVFCRIS